MAQAKLIPIPLKYGRQDQISQRHAPFGVLAECQNLRVRKDGRLGVRNGYSAITMTSSQGALVAYDLLEYQGRLCALGSDQGDGFPTDIHELVNQVTPWRGSDPTADITLSPFTNPREVGGISQLGAGVGYMHSAAGAGLVCMAWKANTISNATFVLICRQDNGQIIHTEKIGITSVASAQVAFAGGTFYVQLVKSFGDVLIQQFTPGSSTAFAAYATHVVGGVGVDSADLVAVTTPSTARVLSVVAKSTGMTAKVYDSAGAQVGSTVSRATAYTQVMGELDQTNALVNIFSVRAGPIAEITTYTFPGAVLALGPTATPVGASGSMTRLPAIGALANAIVTAVNNSTGDVQINYYNQSTHASITTSSVRRMLCRSRIVNAQSGTLHRSIVFSGVVAPALPTLTDPVSGSTTATNVIVYHSLLASVIVASRDLGQAVDPATADASAGLNINLTKDSTTGRLCWGAMRVNQLALGGTILAQPVLTLLDLQSRARRQGVQYGGLLYLSGAVVQAYDGTFLTEVGFNEQPGINSATPSVGAGLLALNATYTYVQHWEYTRADGSLEQSAPSAPVNVSTGAANNTVAVVASAPHSVRCAKGDVLYGGSVVSVLSRTVWDATTGTQGSDLRRCSVVAVSGYALAVTHTDLLSDTVLGKQAVVYVQGERGELSGPLANDAPRGCSFMAVDSGRMILGGLATPNRTQVSKESFLTEPFTFSEFSTFQSRVSRPIVAVATLDGSKVEFTTEEIYLQGQGGPDDQGGSPLDSPQETPTASGAKDWRAMIRYHDGLFYQAQNARIYRIPRGVGAPEDSAREIHDLLVSFPVITATTRHKADDALMFACNATNLQSARLAILDLPNNIWTTDLPPLTASSGIEAIVNFLDTMAYVSGGNVFQQSNTSFADSTGFIPVLLKTKPIYPFGIAGKGLISGVMLCGEYVGDTTWNMRVSLDDGLTFTTLQTFAITAANGYSLGARVRKLFTLPVVAEAGSVVVEYTSTTAGTSDSAQTDIEEIAIEVQVEPGFVNLDPADSA